MTPKKTKKYEKIRNFTYEKRTIMVFFWPILVRPWHTLFIFYTCWYTLVYYENNYDRSYDFSTSIFLRIPEFRNSIQNDRIRSYIYPGYKIVPISDIVQYDSNELRYIYVYIVVQLSKCTLRSKTQKCSPPPWRVRREGILGLWLPLSHLRDHASKDFSLFMYISQTLLHSHLHCQ